MFDETADYSTWLGFPHVNLFDVQGVGVRMLLGTDNKSDTHVET